MEYREFETPSQLSGDVQLIWGMASESTEDRFERERILPDGIVELVFHFGDPLVTTRADGSRCIQLKAFAISQMLEFIEIESAGEVGLLAVRFYPWGAHHFFGAAVSEFIDDSIPAVLLWPDRHESIAELIAPGGTLDSRLPLLEAFLINCRKDCGEDEELDEAIRQIRKSGGQLSVAEICKNLAISEKQLQRKFGAAVGTTPKIFARVSRFLDICKRMSEYRDKSLTELAMHCGFYDQSHFNKEFKRFSGFTPKDFFRRDDIGYADL